MKHNKKELTPKDNSLNIDKGSGSIRKINRADDELKLKMEKALISKIADSGDSLSDERLSKLAIQRIKNKDSESFENGDKKKSPKNKKSDKLTLFERTGVLFGRKDKSLEEKIKGRENLARRSKEKQIKLRRKDYEILKRKQKNKIVALSVFIFVMLIFATSLYFFDTHYPLNTTFRGNDLSLKPKYDKIISPLNEIFTIKGSFGDPIKIDLSSLGGEIHTTVSNNPAPIYWIENSINGLELEGTDEYYYDENKLRKWLQDHIDEMQGDRLPSNAELKVTDEGVEIIDEIDSNIFSDSETFIDNVILAVNKGKNEISTDEYYRKASIRHSDLQAEYDRLSSMKINIPQIKAEIGPKAIMSLYNEDRTVNEAAVEQYCWTLSENYDTYKRRRHFKTHDGREIELEPGEYGWRMDVEATKNDLVALLNQGAQGDLEITYQRTAKQYGEDDIGGTYIEVPRDEQKIYLFVNGKLELEADVVTGDPTRNHQTDLGVQMIYGKHRHARLVAEGNEDPRDNYDVPVECWMPFNGGEGFHSAYWYADWQFGGNTYIGNGSHGCINMKLPDVIKLFSLVDVGTPVVVY